MLLYFKNKLKSITAPPEAGTAALPHASFVPYQCHYNPHTLLTKNGELMQTLRIAANRAGLNYENGSDPTIIAREVIRKAIRETIDTDRIAVWAHTIRKRRPIENTGTFSESFPQAVHNRWQQHHHWKYEYYNEIYLTFLYEGQSAKMLDGAHIKDTLMPRKNRDFRNAYLDVMYEELDSTVTKLMHKIGSQFQAHRLSIVERIPPRDEIPVTQAIFYSEPMEFLGTLLNLRTESYPLPQLDISTALLTTLHTFGFNALETKNVEGKRRFGALLTLKQYREVPAETIDRLLQAPMEFIITQAFYFIPHAGALKQYKEQKELLDISGDSYCVETSGISEMMASHTERETDFGEHQISIMILGDDFKHLDEEIAKVQSAFSELGLITIREDLRLEEAFWAQLPGNFEFIRRKDTLNTSRFGGFCRLNRFPNGTADHNHWGSAVTILPTLVGSPYFFNFHHQDNGHTVLLDFNSFTDPTNPILTNFLLSESRKFNGRIYVFDRNSSADLLFEKMGGEYHRFPSLMREKNGKALQLNPLQLQDTPRNRSFLLAWCASIASADMALSDAQKETVKTAIAQVYEKSPAERNFAALAASIAALDPSLTQPFSAWHGRGMYAGIIDGENETTDFRTLLHGFDMDPLLRHRRALVPVFSYLMHRIITALDGRPTMIILHEAWDLLENPFIAPRIESLMEMLKQNNAMLFMTSSKPLQVAKSYSFATVMKSSATHIYLPDDIGRNYVSETFGLGEEEHKLLFKMERQKGDLLIRQNNESIALRADLKSLDDLHVIFANDRKNLASLLGKYSSSGQG